MQPGAASTIYVAHMLPNKYVSHVRLSAPCGNALHIGSSAQHSGGAQSSSPQGYLEASAEALRQSLPAEQTECHFAPDHTGSCGSSNKTSHTATTNNKLHLRLAVPHSSPMHAACHAVETW